MYRGKESILSDSAIFHLTMFAEGCVCDHISLLLLTYTLQVFATEFLNQLKLDQKTIDSAREAAAKTASRTVRAFWLEVVKSFHFCFLKLFLLMCL